ncbi:MAG: N-6 DNA methylase, partial [Blastocatellia bacterium]
MLDISSKLQLQYRKDAWDFLNSIKGLVNISADILLIIGYFILLRWIDSQEKEVFKDSGKNKSVSHFSIWEYLINSPLHQINIVDIEKERKKIFLRFGNYSLEEPIEDLHRIFDRYKTDRYLIKLLLDFVSKMPADGEKLFIAYETFITVFTEHHKNAFFDYFFPTQLAELMVNLAEPKSGESIYDPH